MFLSCLLLLLSLATSIVVLVVTGIYKIWYFDLIGIATIPILYLVYFGVLLIILFVVGLIIKTKKKDIKPNNFCFWMVYQVNYILCMLVSKVEVINKDLLPKDKRYLMVFNHRSNWDPMVLMYAFRKEKIYFVTKPSNMNIPIAGPFIQRAGFLPINRENNKEGLKTILKAIQYIKEDRGSIGIAPEGTRNKKLEETLLDFHSGSFKIAFKGEVPIVVVSLKNCECIHKNFPLRRTKIKIEILKVIDVKEYEYKDIVTISNETYELMKKNLEEK